MDRRKVDIVVMAMLIIASVIVLTNDNLSQGGAQTEMSSLFLPRIVAGLIICFSLFISAGSLFKLLNKQSLSSAESISLSGFWGVNIYVALFIAYWYLVPIAGFLVVTPFVMFAIACLLGGRKWVPMIAMSIIVPILVFYGSIHFLRVFLPTWSLS